MLINWAWPNDSAPPVSIDRLTYREELSIKVWTGLLMGYTEEEAASGRGQVSSPPYLVPVKFDSSPMI